MFCGEIDSILQDLSIGTKKIGPNLKKTAARKLPDKKIKFFYWNFKL